MLSVFTSTLLSFISSSVWLDVIYNQHVIWDSSKIFCDWSLEQNLRVQIINYIKMLRFLVIIYYVTLLFSFHELLITIILKRLHFPYNIGYYFLRYTYLI